MGRQGRKPIGIWVGPDRSGVDAGGFAALWDCDRQIDR